MMYRLSVRPGEWLDRAAPLEFTFEGRSVRGFAGDTLSSALVAAEMPYLGRSFKYHRPRSLLSCANHDSNALFDVDGVPNVRGDVTALRAGMRVTAVNTFGGLERDRARVLDRLSRFLPVGFYYKAFHGRRLFPRWERMFRTLTGLGRVPLEGARQPTPKRYGFCDVLVIGGGPSGLAAACAAAEAGARVALVEESHRLGVGAAPAEESGPIEALVHALAGRVTVLTGAVAAGYYADHWVAIAEAHRLTKMRAKAVVFATGVIEQPAVFRNNDLPGILLGSGAQRLLRRMSIAPGRAVAIVTANAEGYALAEELHAAGVHLAALVDLRTAAEARPEAARAAALGLVPLTAHAPYEAIAGAHGVTALIVAPFDGQGLEPGRRRRIRCDAVLMSVGFAPAQQLLLQAGARPRFDAQLEQFVPEELPAGVFAAGRVNGVYGLAARIADGRRAGREAAAHAAGFAVVPAAAAAAAGAGARDARRPSHPFPVVDHPRGKCFVDFDEDLTVRDLENAIQEGFDSSELLKRYSTVGMGPSQGKHSHMNALRILARARGLPIEALGLTTARPPYHPVPLKLLAGRGFHIERRTPIDAEHAALGAVFMPAGNWRRPEYYARSSMSRAACIAAEVDAVRTQVGLIDVGTLGKIEIYGPHAGEFLDRAYAGRFAEMKVGTTRYGLMLDESGVIIDDGVIARLAPEAFYFTTTTSGSAGVYRELTRLNALWGLECSLVNVTGHRAAFNLAGPASREVLARLTPLALDESAFPFLGARRAVVSGSDALLLRVGFVGELGYEIHVPAGAARRVWRALLEAGRDAQIRPFGVEAQRLLRLEKGHFIVSQDTDGLTDPFEANAGWAVALGKPFFVGQRSLKILKARGPRQKLIGIEFLRPEPAPRESQLVIEEGRIGGRVTSAAYSHTLGRTIGLALVRPELAQAGRELAIRGDGGAMLPARVVPTPFYDPEQRRQRPNSLLEAPQRRAVGA